MKHLVTLFIFVIPFILPHFAYSQNSEDPILVYLDASYNEENLINSTQVHWINLQTLEEAQVSIPSFSYYASSPSTPYVAVADQEGFIYIINVITGELEHLDMALALSNTSLIYDEQSLISRSMVWSPNGQYLAYVGVQNSETDIYIYDIKNSILSNVSEDIDIKGQELDISSWSNDAQWLSFTAIVNDENSLDSKRKFIIVSKDGNTLFTSEFDVPLCRMIWSQDNQYLATNTACYEGLSDISRLIVIQFDPKSTLGSENLKIIEVTEAKDGLFRYLTWQDNILEANVSTIDQIQRINFNPQIDTMETIESPNMPDSAVGRTQLGNWQLWQELVGESLVTHIYDSTTDVVFDLPPLKNLCISLYTAIASKNPLVSLTAGCGPNLPPAIQIWDFANGRNLYTINGEKNHQLIPIGFVYSN